MKKKLLVFLCIILIFGLTACSNTQKSSKSEIFAMDTVMDLTVYGGKADEALKAAADKIYALDNQLSVTKTDSEVSKLNSAGGNLTRVSDALLTQIKIAAEVSKRSNGAYDITVLPLVSLWGFDTPEAHVPAQTDIEAAKALIDYRNVEVSGDSVRLNKGTTITLASIAKGYTSETLMGLFRDMGVKSAVVSLGGNVQTLGTKPDGSKWKVGIQDPKNSSGNLGILETADMAVVTSGGYQRFFEQNGKTYHHILDPKTGYPSNNGLISVTIVCPDGTLADALSTTLFVLGKDRALEYWRTYGGFETVLVTDDGKVTVTSGLKNSFTLSGNDYTLEFAS